MNKEDNIQELANLLQEDAKQPLAFDFDAIRSDSSIEEYEEQTTTVKILSIIGGVFGTVGFTIFLFLIGLYDSPATLITIGLFMIIAAIFLSRLEKNFLWDSLSSSLYLLGYFSSIYGCDGMHWDLNIIIISYMVIAALTLYLSRSFLLRFLSVLLIIGNLVVLLLENNLEVLYYPLLALLVLVLVVFSLYESTLLANKILNTAFYSAVRLGLVIAIFILLQATFFKQYLWFNFNSSYLWVTSVVVLLLLGFTSYKIAPLLYINKTILRILFSLGSVAILVPAYYYPAISFSILFLLLSFRTKYKTGLVLAIISFLYSISMVYYNLNYNLLIKSLMLIGTGIIFLIVYLIFNKKLTSSEKN